MKRNYLDLLARAVEASRSLGLLSTGNQPSFTSQEIPKESISGLLRNFTDYLYSRGLSCSESINGNCVMIHDQLQKFLDYYGVDSHITIGSMHGQGWDYCQTSIDQLKSELSNPDISREIRVHTWLTLNDASILDWTGQAWCDVEIRENHPAESCLVYFPQGQQDETHHYMPQLVGREFLVRTHCIAHVRTS
jgi:hypothetical protein